MSAIQPIATTLPLELDHAPQGVGGLLALIEGVERALPLQSVRVRSSVAGTLCRTELVQRFTNDHDVPIEAVHIFPLPPDAAVIEAELRAGEITVRAECRERAEAEQRFDEARTAGHRAALLTAERDDVHTLRVTNLPPKEAITVRIVVVQVLSVSDGRVHYRFPTVIAPRYLPGEATGHRGDGVLPDSDRVPDASSLQPPLRLEGGTTLDLEVGIAGPVRQLAASLHAVRLDLDDGTVRVAPSGKATCDRDFVLAFTTGEAQHTAVRAWTDGSYTLVLVEPPTAAIPTPLPRDAVFVVDISGSMGGAKMSAAKSALTSALHGLLPGDRFRVIAFDDRVEHFRADLVAYDDRTLTAADAWIAALRPRGGTEMLPAIQAALSGETDPARLRTVLFITDGQAWNEQELVAAVANRRMGARFFTLGIDTAVNDSLLQRLARVGGGTCELATPDDDIEATVTRLEARFGAPLVTGLVLEGATAARPEPAVLFTGRPATLLVEGAPETVSLRGRVAGGAWSGAANTRTVDFPLGALWARERVASLEDRLTLRPYEEEALRPEILRIALAHHIASRFTAFVAVEQTRTVAGEPIIVVQPAELPAQWDEGFRQAPVDAAPMGGPPLRSSAPHPTPAPMRASAMSAPPSPVAAVTSQDSRKRRKQAPAAPAERAAAADPAAHLAQTQRADGSFDQDVARTAAALLALVLLGHTRRTGLRRRTVLKAATWLAAHRDDPLAALALEILERAELGEAVRPDDRWEALRGAGPEGAALTGAC